jgi:protein-L-isoaspartate(D-aspartate) O-methyltransferase
MAPPPPGDPGSTATGQPHLRQLIDRYADRLKAEGAIRSPAVEQAFRTVPRHRLLETFFHRPIDAADFTAVHHDPLRPRPKDLELIYSDTALGTRLVEQFGARLPASSTSQPSLVADMLELLELTRGVGVLEIGAGTGYNAALLAELVGDQRLVTSVDVAEDVVAQTRRLLAGAGYPGITVLCRDGFDGVPERAPFDRIVATVGCADVSPHWAEQLAEDGRLLVPLRHAGGHPLLLLQREDGRLRGRVARWSGFMDARGQLHADRLWSMEIAQPDDQGEVGEREPWPEFGADETGPGPDDPVDEHDFLFYLGLVDRRACLAPGGVSLSDGRNGWAPPTRAASAGGGTKPWPTTSTVTTPSGWPSAAPRSATTGRPSFPSRSAAQPCPRAGPWTAPPFANSSGSRSPDPGPSRERRGTSGQPPVVPTGCPSSPRWSSPDKPVAAVRSCGQTSTTSAVEGTPTHRPRWCEAWC